MEKGRTRFFGDPAPIQKNYLVDDFRADASRYDLLGSVHVQVGAAPGDEIKETAWLEKSAKAHGLPNAVVAFCDLAAPNAQAILDEQQLYDRVRGIRHIVGRAQSEDALSGSHQLLSSQTWRENLASLAVRGLSFDLQLIPQQLERAAELLSAIPDLRVVVCHCASPWDQSDEGLDYWRRGLSLLAARPNTYCKISGLAMFNHQWTPDSVRPIIESCIGLFGASRCMFGSNFPVDKLHKGFIDVWQTYEAIAEQYSAAEQDALFVETARSFYRLEI